MEKKGPGTLAVDYGFSRPYLARQKPSIDRNEPVIAPEQMNERLSAKIIYMVL